MGHINLPLVGGRGTAGGLPSVVEVGYSEALHFLRLDAKWKLINSDCKTLFVVIVQQITDPSALHIECWHVVGLEDWQMGQAAARLPACLQLFDTNPKGTVASRSPGLFIPHCCLFDEPNANESDAMLTNAELSSFALRVFQQMY